MLLSLKDKISLSCSLISVRSELKINFSLGILLNRNSISLDLFNVSYLLFSKLNCDKSISHIFFCTFASKKFIFFGK